MWISLSPFVLWEMIPNSKEYEEGNVLSSFNLDVTTLFGSNSFDTINKSVDKEQLKEHASVCTVRLISKCYEI